MSPQPNLREKLLSAKQRSPQHIGEYGLRHWDLALRRYYQPLATLSKKRSPVETVRSQLLL